MTLEDIDELKVLWQRVNQEGGRFFFFVGRGGELWMFVCLFLGKESILVFFVGVFVVCLL